MKVVVEVEVNDLIVRKMGEDRVKGLLHAFLDNNAEEFLKEQHEDETDEWIKT